MNADAPTMIWSWYCLCARSVLFWFLVLGGTRGNEGLDNDDKELPESTGINTSSDQSFLQRKRGAIYMFLFSMCPHPNCSSSSPLRSIIFYVYKYIYFFFLW